MEILANIDVPDLDTAIAFYERAIDLRLARRLFEGTAAELTSASVRILLLQKDAGSAPVPGAALSRDYQRHWTPVGLDFVVPELEAATASAMTVGARLEMPIQNVTWGRQVCLSDPFGHGFCLLQWKGAGYDAAQSPAAC